MPLTPISKESMRDLMEQAIKEEHLEKIKRIVKEIYRAAVDQAKSKYKSSYYYPVNELGRVQIASTEFYTINKEEILSELQKLFPGCSVDYKMLERGKGGEWHDVSITYLMGCLYTFLFNQESQLFIVIDWGL